MSLYFNNNSKPNVNLKKAEILVYYKKGGLIDYKTVGFPNLNDTIISKDPISDNIVVDGISTNFYPISMTMWGKDYDIANKFRMVEINDNNLNVTTFEVKNNLISLSIKIGKILSRSNVTNFGVNDTKYYLDSARDDKTYPNLIGKVIILYDDQENQSIVNKSEIREMYRESYIGIF
jgi:hypothetical protein